MTVSEQIEEGAKKLVKRLSSGLLMNNPRAVRDIGELIRLLTCVRYLN